jgi:hyaluronoglucosaminidase
MQRLKVQWFDLQVDDISTGIDAAGQARLANALLDRLRQRDPHAQMIVCPTYYWGTGEEPAAHAYLRSWAQELDPEVYVIWTGDAVVTSRITREAAESFRRAVGHRLVIWDNYPVNDGNPTMHLGPVTGRDPGLADVCDGYMSNPMHAQNEINRLPLLTMADFAYNPWAYDPERSIGQAILHLADTREQQETLADLVELYPGMLIFGKGTAYNPFVTRFEELTATPHSHAVAVAYQEHAEGVLQRLEEQFPARFTEARRTLRADLGHLNETRAAVYADE